MAAIIERQGRFLVRVRRLGFLPVAKTFTSKKDAQAYGRSVEADMESGRWTEKTIRAPSLRNAIKIYRTTVASAMKGASTYAYRFDEFERLPFAAKPVNKITSFELAAWRDQLSVHSKPGTVVRKLAMLSAIFSFCVKERGWLPINPLSTVRRPRVMDARNRVLSQDEVFWLFAAARTSKALWLAPALAVLLHSAMRRGELFSLERHAIDFGGCTAHLSDTKNGASRDAPLCPRSLSALRELDTVAAAQGCTTILPVGAVGSISTRFKTTVKRALRLYQANCAESGSEPLASFLSDLRLHDCRHHAVSAWANTGALSLVELMAISGHKTPRMLARYAHMNATTLAAKMAVLSS